MKEVSYDWQQLNCLRALSLINFDFVWIGRSCDTFCASSPDEKKPCAALKESHSLMIRLTVILCAQERVRICFEQNPDVLVLDFSKAS